MLNRRFKFAVPAFLVLVASTCSFGQSKDDTFVPAPLLIRSQEPRMLPAAHPAVDRGEYERFLNTQMELFRSGRVLASALRDPKLAGLRLTPAKMAKGLSVTRVGSTEILAIKFVGDDGKPSPEVTNAILSSYLISAVNMDRFNKVDRLEKLRKLWEKYQSEIRTKRQSLKTLAASAGTVASGTSLEVASHRLREDTLQKDRLDLQRVGFAAQIDVIKPRSTTEPGLSETRRLSEELAVVDSQLGLLFKRIDQLT